MRIIACRTQPVEIDQILTHRRRLATFGALGYEVPH